MKKYVIGYSKDGRFVVLQETDNLRVAVAVRRVYADRRSEEITIKKRAAQKA